MSPTRVVTLLGILVLSFVSPVMPQAQATKPTISVKNSAKNDEVEIRRWLDNWGKAFAARDLDAIMSLYASDVVAYDVVPPLQYVGKAAYRKDYSEFLAQYKGPISVEYRDLHIFASGNVAFATSLERISGTLTSGQKSDVWMRVTSGFRKINGKWLDVHDHVSVPVDMQTGKGALNLKP